MARAIAALNHPNICQIHDIGPGYLVMEFIEGKPLSGPLRGEEALKLAVQIASAMEEAHSKGILHRDLKPANLLVTGKGAIKLLDFGLAKLTTESDSDSTQTIEGAILGTAAYMSPEQAEGEGALVCSWAFSQRSKSTVPGNGVSMTNCANVMPARCASSAVAANVFG